MRSARPALRWASYALFFAYVGLLVIAGGWGILFARVDMAILIDLDIDSLGSPADANLLSQYRFLRAMELGFGLWALIYRKSIHADKVANRLFLTTMAAGVASRLVSIPLDGVPTAPMLFFLAVELVGVVVIFLYTRTTITTGGQ